MKHIILFSLFLGFAESIPMRSRIKKGSRYINLSDGEGKLHLVDLQQRVIENNRQVESSNIRYFLYTRSNPSLAQELYLNNTNSISNSNFENRRTMFLVHGWISNRDSESNTLVRDAALNDEDINLIVVDWSYYASNINYIAAAADVPPMAKIVAQFIDFLSTRGLDFKNLHLVGFSLGGQAVGITARNCQLGKVPRITSLDPAGPQWGPANTERIKSSDANYVEIIHTNADNFGNEDLLGHVDFFPNGGGSQPGCFRNSACSHLRAYKYYTETIGNTRWMGIRCNNIDDAKMQRCNGNPSYYMGGSWDSKNGTGIFWLRTKSRSPYV